MMTESHFSQPAERPAHVARCASRISSALGIGPPRTRPLAGIVAGAQLPEPKSDEPRLGAQHLELLGTRLRHAGYRTRLHQPFDDESRLRELGGACRQRLSPVPHLPASLPRF